MAQHPLNGSSPRSMSSTRGSSSEVITTQSAVTAGLGYLYVYGIMVVHLQICHKDSKKVGITGMIDNKKYTLHFIVASQLFAGDVKNIDQKADNSRFFPIFVGCNTEVRRAR